MRKEMSKKEAKARIEKLREVIDHHRYLYHVLDKQEISDAALDSLKHELYLLEQLHPDLITADSPTQRVGGKALDKFRKVRHRTPMLSIEDVFDPEELDAWFKRLRKLTTAKLEEFYCEVKMDGLAVSLVYEDGLLIEASTRGDGLVGEDVLRNLKTVEAIPLRLRLPEETEIEKFLRAFPEVDERRFRRAAAQHGRIEVRGDCYMLKSVFEELNKELGRAGEPLLANPRNGAAGSIRQLDPEITRGRKLSFFGYALLVDAGLARHDQAHETMKLLGIAVNPVAERVDGAAGIKKFHAALAERREKLPYWTDGAVAVVNDDALFERLGVVGKTPRGMIAYKFPAQQVTTVVEDIVVQVGRTGALTPVAVLRPASVGGTTVTHASLHNIDEIGRLGLKIGDTVVLEKAGDVIPKVIKVLPEARTGKERTFLMPAKCPVCGSKAERRAGEVATYCTNKGCFAQTRERLLHFLMALDIQGVGDRIVERFLDEGLIRDAADLFSLKEDDIASLERFGELSAKNVVAAIREKRRVPLERFIVGLGIRHVGSETAVDLAAHFRTLDSLRRATEADLSDVRDVGPVMAKSVVGFFLDKGNAALVDKLLRVVTVERGAAPKKGPLTGQTFVLTGTLEGLAREEAKKRIREFGGDVAESVSQATSFVVVGSEPGSKYAKAKRLGVPTLNEKEFVAMLRNSNKP